MLQSAYPDCQLPWQPCMGFFWVWEVASTSLQGTLYCGQKNSCQRAAAAGLFGLRPRTRRRHGSAVTRLDIWSDLKDFFKKNPNGVYPGHGEGTSTDGLGKAAARCWAAFLTLAHLLLIQDAFKSPPQVCETAHLLQ